MVSTGHPTFPPSYLREYSGTRLFTVSIAFAVIMPISVALRFLVRHGNKSSLGWDDYLIFPALVSIWGVDAIAMCMSATFVCGNAFKLTCRRRYVSACRKGLSHCRHGDEESGNHGDLGQIPNGFGVALASPPFSRPDNAQPANIDKKWYRRSFGQGAYSVLLPPYFCHKPISICSLCDHVRDHRKRTRHCLHRYLPMHANRISVEKKFPIGHCVD